MKLSRISRALGVVHQALIGVSVMAVCAVANATSTTPPALASAFTAGGTTGTDVTTDFASGIVAFIILKKVLSKFGLT